MKTKTKIASMVAAILASSLTIGTAQADAQASAQAIVAFKNFQIINDNTGVQATAADFSTLNGTSTIKVNASVDSTATTIPQNSSTDATSLASTAVVGNGTTGVPALSAITPTNINTEITNNLNGGTGNLGPAPAPAPAPVAQVQFTAANIFPMSGNFATTGANDYGTPVSGFGVATQNHVNIFSGSYASLNSTGTAGTDANVGLTSSFQFKVATAASLTFNFDIGAYIATYLSNTDLQTAKSAYTVTFTLEDASGNSALNKASNANINSAGTFSLTNNVSAPVPGNGKIQQKSILSSNVISQLSYPNNGIPALTPGINVTTFALNTISQTFQTNVLDATQLYSLTATITTDANVQLKTVAEPDTLALLGIGLLGMALASRKFKNSSSVTYA
jgi:hypothetical protein